MEIVERWMGGSVERVEERQEQKEVEAAEAARRERSSTGSSRWSTVNQQEGAAARALVAY